MTLKVIGAGLGRTGTLSLKLALEALGIGRCHHMIEVSTDRAAQQWLDLAEGRPVPWETLFEGFCATVDYPSAPFYEKLAQHYPEAKVILSVRDPDQWFDSTQNTVFKHLQTVMQERGNPWARMVRKLVIDSFDGKVHDRAHMTQAFRAHCDRVKAAIPPARLLVYEAGSGWDPLCRFLGLPRPPTPFPWVNRTADWARARG